MMKLIGSMYITMMPVILGGVFNMIFTKTPVYKKLRHPIDNGRALSDGRRVFGDNKTWIGFFSMIVFCMLAQVLWGVICSICDWDSVNELYFVRDNTVGLNLLAGFLFGLAYVVLELPNSFIKRRVGIASGKTNKGIVGAVFFVIDQIDSLLGVALMLTIFTPLSFAKYVGYIVLGAGTHIAVNFILYALKIRKNI